METPADFSEIPPIDAPVSNGVLTAPQPSPSLSEFLYDQLRSEILVGSLRVGQILRQEKLAKHYNVSRVPLREALSRLEADGLVVARPRRGYAVASLAPEEIVEVFDLRMVIEEHAGWLAAQARTPADIGAVEAVLSKMEKLDHQASDFRCNWSLLNYEFHSRIVASSRRKRLARIAGNLRSSVELYVQMELGITGDVAEAVREHREMLEAFRAGDAKGLAELSRRHVENTARRLLTGLRSRATRIPLGEAVA